MKRAVTLLRVSSSGQTKRAGADDGYSLEVQRDGCIRKAAQLDADLVREVVGPAQSASKGMYPALKSALDFVREAGDIDYFIVYRLDRLARDELTQFSVLAELRAAGCQLVSVTEQIDETPQGMLALGILASVNAYRSRDDGRKILDGLTKKALLGGTPKRVPLGYLNVKHWDGSNDIRTVEVDPERAPLVRFAFAAYATGEFTLNELVEELWERGLRSRPTPKRPASKIPRSTIARMLKDRYYIGIVNYTGIDYDGNHPLIIDRGTFDLVQELLAQRNASGEKHWRHTHPLKGSLYCGCCGERLRFTQVTNRHGTPYRYFVCGTRHDGKPCALPYVAETDVEAAVARYYETTVRLSAKQLADLQTRLIDAFDRITADREQRLADQRRLITQLKAERRRLLDAHLAGAVPIDLLREKQDEIAAQIVTATSKLAAASASSTAAKRGLAAATRDLRRAGALYAEVDAVTQRAWNQTFFTRIYVGLDDATAAIVGAELAQPYADVLSDELAESLDRLKNAPAAVFAAGGSNVEQIVETVGIEPTSAVA